MNDEFTRENPAIKIGRNFKAAQVKEVLRSVDGERKFPQFMRSDNGREFVAEAIKKFLAENNIKTAYAIQPSLQGLFKTNSPESTV